MNLAATGLGAAGAVGVLAAVAAIVVPVRSRSAVVGVGTALAGAAGAVAGFAAVAGESFSVALPGLLPLSGMLFTLDALGGLFVAVRRARRTAASTGWCRGDDQVERAQCESGGAV